MVMKLSPRLQSFFEVLNVSSSLNTLEEIRNAADIIEFAQCMKSGERDTLYAAFYQGPIGDGYVPSKQSRDVLLTKGYMAKVVVKGEEGFNACTYKGAKLMRLLAHMSTYVDGE